MKKFFLILLILLQCSCLSSLNKERLKSVESAAASARINNSDNNNKAIFDEMD